MVVHTMQAHTETKACLEAEVVGDAGDSKEGMYL